MRNIGQSADAWPLQNLQLLGRQTPRCVKFLGLCKRTLLGLVGLLAGDGGMIELHGRSVFLPLPLYVVALSTRLVDNAFVDAES